MKTLDLEAARVIRECTNTEIEIDEKAEVIDVCKAVEELNEKARQEGIQEGKKEGIQEGRKKTRCEDIRNVMEAFHVTADEAMKVLKITTEDQLILKKMIQKIS